MTIEIKGRAYTVETSQAPGPNMAAYNIKAILGLVGKRGAVFMAYEFNDGTYSDLIRV